MSEYDYVCGGCGSQFQCPGCTNVAQSRINALKIYGVDLRNPPGADGLVVE